MNPLTQNLYPKKQIILEKNHDLHTTTFKEYMEARDKEFTDILIN